MARHTNKRRNTRRRRQIRSKRRSQQGGGLFSSKDDDIKELQEKIDKCNKNIPEWKAEIAKLQSEKSAPKQGIFSNFFGSKENSTPESVPMKEEGEQVAPEPVPIKEEGASKEGESVPESVPEPVAPNSVPMKEEGASEEGEEDKQEGGRNKYSRMNGGSHRRRRHRSRRHRSRRYKRK
jgi:hypothetical protein